MAINSIVPSYPVFLDTSGDPLDGGDVYIGEIDKDPVIVANRVLVYWDEQKTQVAAQPLDTAFGRITKPDGTPANVFVAGDYSITVRDSGTTVYSAPRSPVPVTALGIVIVTSGVVMELHNSNARMQPIGSGGSFSWYGGSAGAHNFWGGPSGENQEGAGLTVYAQNHPTYAEDIKLRSLDKRPLWFKASTVLTDYIAGIEAATHPAGLWSMEDFSLVDVDVFQSRAITADAPSTRLRVNDDEIVVGGVSTPVFAIYNRESDGHLQVGGGASQGTGFTMRYYGDSTGVASTDNGLIGYSNGVQVVRYRDDISEWSFKSDTLILGRGVSGQHTAAFNSVDDSYSQWGGGTSQGSGFCIRTYGGTTSGASTDAGMIWYADNVQEFRFRQDLSDYDFKQNTTSNISDRREKEDERAITEAERACARQCLGLIKTYLYKGKSNANGRRVGVVAQDLIALFESHGLNALDYAMVSYDTEEDRYRVAYNEFQLFAMSAVSDLFRG